MHVIFQKRSVIRWITFDIAYSYTKFDNSSFSHSGDISGGVNTKIGQLTPPHPFQVRFVTGKLGLAAINIHTKFDISNSSRYGDMKGVAKCRK